MNNLDLAGVMALSSGLKANHVMRCLDLNIPPADEELARMCRDILNSCIRNTEEAEKATQAVRSDVGSGRGQAKGLWLMIEESELAKTFREDDKKKVDAQVPDKAAINIIDTARSCKAELEEVLACVASPSPSLSASASPNLREELTTRSREALKSLASIIETSDDPSKLEEMLGLNDDISSLLARLSARRPDLKKLKGLGISVEEVRNTVEAMNGHAPSVHSILEKEEDEPVTPRIDKGKQRAEPEPEEPQLVLSPTVEVPEFYEEEADHEHLEESLLGQVESIVSPTDRSKSWVAEEGEVFRKGAVLLTPEEMENEYDSEELRKELLEAMVERPPPRALNEGFDDNVTEQSTSPIPPSPSEPQKLPPRPYIRRARSSSSNVNSPASQEGSPLSSPLEDNE